MSQHTLALRDARLRKHFAIVVYLFVAPSLTMDDDKPIKVGQTADGLRLKRRLVRDALALLVQLGYLVCVQMPGTGTPGLYRLPTGASEVPLSSRAA